MMVKVGYPIDLAELLVGCLGRSVLKVDLDGSVKKKRVTSGFGLKVTLEGSLCASVPCALHIYF